MSIKPYQPDTTKEVFTPSEKETMEWLSLVATMKIKEIQKPTQPRSLPISIGRGIGCVGF